MKFSCNNVFISGAFLLCAQVSSFAADSTSLELATGNKTQMVRTGAQWNWSEQWFKSSDHYLGAYWDATLAQWRGNNYQKTGVGQNLTDIGITPVFRYQTTNKQGFYAEAGIGMHFLSEIYDNNGRTFSTNFQFGDHIGGGYITSSGVDIGLKIQHYSNGAIKHPNPGVNFAVVKVAIPLR